MQLSQVYTLALNFHKVQKQTDGQMAVMSR